MTAPNAHPNPSPFKLFLLHWAYVFPGVLLCDTLADWVFGELPVPDAVRVAASTGLLTLSLVYVVSPWLLRTFAGWLRQG